MLDEPMVTYQHYGDTKGKVRFRQYAKDPLPKWADVVRTEAADQLVQHQGWTYSKASLYDEEGVEGWRWEGPDGEELYVVGSWSEPVEAPDL